MSDRPSIISSSQGSMFAQAERVLMDGHALPVRTVLRLQQTLGNREVARLLTPQTSALQTLPVLPTPAPTSNFKQRLAAAWGRLSRRSFAGKQ